MAKKLVLVSVALFLAGCPLHMLGTKKLPNLTIDKVNVPVACKGQIIEYFWPKPDSSAGKTGCIYFYEQKQNYYCFANTFRNNSQDPLLDGIINHIPYQDFDNTAWLPTYIDGLNWITTEHYFHAQKFKQPNIAYVKMLTEKLPRKNLPIYPGDLPKVVKGGVFNTLAKRFDDWKDWDKISHLVMLKAVRAKFSQHNALKNILLDTYPKIIIEDTEQAPYVEDTWGAGKSYTGCNQLGQVLMHVRQELHDGQLYKFEKGDAQNYYERLSGTGPAKWTPDKSGDKTYIPDGYEKLLADIKKTLPAPEKTKETGTIPTESTSVDDSDLIKLTQVLHGMAT